MTQEAVKNFDIEQMGIRSATPADYEAIRALFNASLEEGQLPDNDTGADIEHLSEAYFSDDGASHFWVAEYNGEVIGMIGVQKTSEDVAEMRRLRVREPFRRRGVGSALMKQAIAFCRDQGYLKVTLDVRIDRDPAISMFDKFGFQLARTREVNDRKMLDFYIDLYREPAE